MENGLIETYKDKIAKISEFCLIVLVGISLRPDFDKFNRVIYFNICFLCTVENEKFVALLLWHTSLI